MYTLQSRNSISLLMLDGCWWAMSCMWQLQGNLHPALRCSCVIA